MPFDIEDNSLVIFSNKLKLCFVEHKLSQSTDSLNSALESMGPKDILLTLPSSKDQILSDKKIVFKGYTDFLRTAYPQSELVMSFVSPDFNAALLTDHVAVKDIEDNLSKNIFEERVNSAIRGFQTIRNIENVYIAGVNPHCGEDGIISEYDNFLQESVSKIKDTFPKIKICGLIPGDTILFNPQNKNNLFIFTFHDQALGPFKRLNGLTGINLTLGLPFKRVSVDHGTAFDLFGKNSANYQGMLYLLDEILNWA
ncbi:MAG: 4-hydroxythreonine-4-phosphate dehydrogenase PdxA [Bacteriovoracaceae bacterium]|nr:4-hydroxythreonine-4-phosphate dehydrogenase PdxA [Bacteriovoracaceae bacterium]